MKRLIVALGTFFLLASLLITPAAATDTVIPAGVPPGGTWRVLTEQERQDAIELERHIQTLQPAHNPYSPAEAPAAEDNEIQAWDPECEDETLCRRYLYTTVGPCGSCGCWYENGETKCFEKFLKNVYEKYVCGTSIHCWKEYDDATGCALCLWTGAQILGTRICAI